MAQERRILDGTPSLTRPLTKQDYAAWLGQPLLLPLLFEPGGYPGYNEHYSGYDTQLLSFVIEQRAPKLNWSDDRDFVRRTLFGSLGVPVDHTDVTQCRVSAVNEPKVLKTSQGDKLTRVMPNQVRYDPYYPGPDISAIEQAPQGGDVYVPSGYWVNYLIETAPGHWVASAVDALRMVSGIEAGALLTPSSRDLLWKEKFSDKGGGGVMKAGWFWLDGEKGRTIAQHNGAIKGVNALVMRRSDGISIALLINKDLPGGPSPKGGWRGSGLHAPVQGKELYAIVDGVMAGTEWPAASLDLFPEAGLDPLV
jgi:hypothetical protein